MKGKVFFNRNSSILEVRAATYTFFLDVNMEVLCNTPCCKACES